MKSYKKRDNKRLFRKTRNKRTFNGGDAVIETPLQKTLDYREKYLENDITNIEILALVITLLNNEDFNKKVILKNEQFLNNINSENIGDSFNYSENKSYRNLINDAVQWLVLDYNQDFFNSLFVVLKNCFKNKFYDNPDPFDMLLSELNAMINSKFELNKVTQDVNINNNIVLLKLILEILTTIPVLTKVLYELLNNQKQLLRQYSKSIICIIEFLIKQDIKTNVKVRNLIQTYFKTFALDIKSIVMPALSLIGSCSITAASDVVKTAFSNWFSKPNS